MARRFVDPFIPPRVWRRAISGLVLASLVALALAPAAQAATSTNAWLAKIGSSGANGTAAINAYTTGSGVLVLKLKRLPASRTLAVTVLKTSCKGATLLTLASIRTTSTGAAVRTSSLTRTQATAIKKAATGTAKIAIRIGAGTSAKCGVFVVRAVPAYVAARVPVGRAPSSIAIAPSGVWVTNWWDDTLTRINPVTNAVLATRTLTLPGNAGPEAITSGGGSLWVTTTEEAADETPLAGALLRVDPATGATLATIAIGRGAYDVVYGHAAVWVPNLYDGTVLRIDPLTNQVVATISVLGASSVTFDANAVWVVSVLGNVTRIDPLTNQVVLTIGTQPTGGFIAAANGSIWVSHPGTEGAGDGSVSRINPAANTVTVNIPVGELPYELAVAGGSVWVGLNQTPTLVRINASTHAVINVPVGVGIYAVAATTGNVWAVHNYAIPDGGTEPPTGVVTRIGY